MTERTLVSFFFFGFEHFLTVWFRKIKTCKYSVCHLDVGSFPAGAVDPDGDSGDSRCDFRNEGSPYCSFFRVCWIVGGTWRWTSVEEGG